MSTYENDLRIAMARSEQAAKEEREFLLVLAESDRLDRERLERESREHESAARRVESLRREREAEEEAFQAALEASMRDAAPMTRRERDEAELMRALHAINARFPGSLERALRG